MEVRSCECRSYIIICFKLFTQCILNQYFHLMYQLSALIMTLQSLHSGIFSARQCHIQRLDTKIKTINGCAYFTIDGFKLVMYSLRMALWCRHMSDWSDYNVIYVMGAFCWCIKRKCLNYYLYCAGRNRLRTSHQKIDYCFTGVWTRKEWETPMWGKTTSRTASIIFMN